SRPVRGGNAVRLRLAHAQFAGRLPGDPGEARAESAGLVRADAEEAAGNDRDAGRSQQTIARMHRLRTPRGRRSAFAGGNTAAWPRRVPRCRGVTGGDFATDRAGCSPNEWLPAGKRFGNEAGRRIAPRLDRSFPSG